MRRASKFGPLVALLAILLTTGVAPADVISIDVNQSSALNQTRDVATIQGSIECDADEDIAVLVYVIQTAGRLLNIGIFNSLVNCDPQGNTFLGDLNVEVPAIEGLKYRPGPATVLVKASDPGNTLYEKGFTTRLHPSKP